MTDAELRARYERLNRERERARRTRDEAAGACKQIERELKQTFNCTLAEAKRLLVEMTPQLAQAREQFERELEALAEFDDRLEKSA